MSRSKEHLDAIRAIWMEGYNEGRQVGAQRHPPVVDIRPEDLTRVFEAGSCGNADCPACAPAPPEEKP